VDELRWLLADLRPADTIVLEVQVEGDIDVLHVDLAGPASPEQP
jgi:hypothetical protein